MPAHDATLERAALVSMIATQALVVAASLAPPVLGPAMTSDLALPAAWTGYYASIVFASALVSAQFAPWLIRRTGSLRTSQWTVGFAAAGLFAAATGTLVGVVTSAVLIGLAYAPGNPASSSLLARVTPSARRAFVFSLKQTSIPIGGIVAGVGAPILAGMAVSATGGPSWGLALSVLAVLCLLVGVAVQPWRHVFDEPASGPGRSTGPSPLRLVASVPSLRTLGIVSCSLACVQLGFGPILVAFLAEVSSASLAVAGGVLTIAMATSLALRVVLGAVADRLGGTTVLATIALTMTVTALLCAAVALVGGDRVPFLIVAALGGILGAAAYSWNGVYLAEVARVAPADSVATATAGTMTLVFLGGFIGPAVTTGAISVTGSYATGFVVMAVFAVVAAVAILRAPLAAQTET